nr:protein IN2-1 homolog B-like isoform X3 [Quercus suber]POE45767.1 protein in2-1 like b [Quercus suber]
MASLKVSCSNTVSSHLTFLRDHSAPFSLSPLCKKVEVTQNGFPNTTISLPKLQLQALGKARATVLLSAKMAAGTVNEVLPPLLDSSSEPPPVFDGTTRLYMSYICPYAQRVWIIRNCKGLQDKIKLVPIDLENRPAWYKEKVYSANKDPDKKEFAEELLYYADTFNRAVISSFKGDGIGNEAGAAFDYIETALSKFEDGPFFLGQFSLVDIAYAPFIERFHPFFLDVKKYDIIAGRPKLADWIKEMDKNDAYKQTKGEPKELVDVLKKRFLAQT